MIVYNYNADLEVSDTCVRSSLLSRVTAVPYTCAQMIHDVPQWQAGVSPTPARTRKFSSQARPSDVQTTRRRCDSRRPTADGGTRRSGDISLHSSPTPWAAESTANSRKVLHPPHSTTPLTRSPTCKTPGHFFSVVVTERQRFHCFVYLPASAISNE